MKRLASFAVLLSIAACGAESGQASPASVAAPASRGGGGIDFEMSGNTVDRNSRGDTGSVSCLLNFSATNNSTEDLKSILVEFEVSNAATGAMIDDQSTLVMPFKIAKGERKDAWGPILFDDLRCEDLNVRVTQPTSPGMCVTVNKTPCAPYRLSGTGVAHAE